MTPKLPNEFPKKDLAYARNYSFEVRIGGPRTGEVMVIRGDNFTAAQSVHDAFEVFREVCKTAGVDPLTAEKIIKDRLHLML